DGSTARGEQRLEVRLGVVAHVTDAERLALEVAVPVRDLEADGLQVLDEGPDVDAGSCDAAHGRRAPLGPRGVRTELLLVSPCQRASLHALVAREALRPRLGGVRRAALERA